MATSSFDTTVVIDENNADSLIKILGDEMSPEEALEILGSIPLTIPSHPHLMNLPRQCSSIKEVQDAYKIVKKALEELRELKKPEGFKNTENIEKIEEIKEPKLK